MKLSIVIPVFNSQGSIAETVKELVQVLRYRFLIEIVLVNDGSTDESERVCENLTKEYSDVVRLLSLAKNVGEHNAVMAGLNFCIGDYAVIMDDDLQNPANGVFALVDTIQKTGDDVVYSHYETKHHNLFRNLGSWLNGKVCNLLLQKPRDLYLSSFKVLNRFVVDQVIKYDLPFAYLDGLILRMTQRIGRVKVEHRPRKTGKSGYTLKKLTSLWLNTFTSFSIVPLRISVFAGFLFSFFGLGLGVVTVFEKILVPATPLGWSSIIVSVSVFSGVQLIALGIIGEYLGRSFLFLSKHPQYVVRKQYNCSKFQAQKASDGKI